MTGWDGYGHAVKTGLLTDRHLGQGDRSHGDPQVQFRDGRIVLLDGTVLERGGTLNCVWAVTKLPADRHE